MTYTDVTSQRSLALDALDAAQVYNDHIKRLQELRADEPDRAHVISRQIGEANAALGVAFKIAEIHANLAQADALVDAVAALDHLSAQFERAEDGADATILAGAGR